MKCFTTAVMMSAICSLLSASICTAQQTTLSIPITVPAPQPITVTVQQKLTVGTLTYLATGTLTLTPVASTAELPPVVGPQPDWPLMVAGYLDATTGKQSWNFHVGDLLRITGNAFGDLPGTVKVGLVTLPVTSWSDQDIIVPLSAGLVVPSAGYQVVEVDAAVGGKYAQEMGIVIAAAPVVPSAPADKKVASNEQR